MKLKREVGRENECSLRKTVKEREEWQSMQLKGRQKGSGEERMIECKTNNFNNRKEV